MQEGRASWKRTGRVVLALSVAPIAFRTTLLLDERVGDLGRADVGGYLSDVGAILAFAAVLTPIGRLSRPLGTAAVLLWAFVHYANYETVRVLGALASALDLGYALDSTFFFGSAVATSNPALLIGALLMSGLLAWRSVAGSSFPAALVCALLAVATFAFQRANPPIAEQARWRQTDLFQENVEVLSAMAFARGDERLRFRDSQSAVLDLMPQMGADLDGEPIVEMPNPDVNVLLVILESVSGVHIESLGRQHGWRQEWRMPRLSAIAERNLHYSSFFAHQRRTNRGVYSLLCGDLPTLLPGLAKMSSYIEGGRACLPETLRRNGFETVYLQAAPLAFMMKDQFMGRAGFDRVYGRPFFGRHYAVSRWGVDDLAMLEQAGELIAELQDGEKPWFLTMLTVGTHHPFVFPEGFQAGSGTDMQRSLAYLDVAVGRFFKTLRELDVPKNTLIILTSDESAANAGFVGQNWSYLVISTPDRDSGLVTESFGQMDIALSVLDYLGLGDEGSHFLGRSVFRRYAEERWTFFSNTNLSYMGARTPDGHLLLCRGVDAQRIALGDEGLCSKYQLENQQFFSTSQQAIAGSQAEFRIVGQMASRSVATGRSDAEQRTFEMMSDPIFVLDIPEGVSDKMIHGGQYVNLKEGEWLEVELEVRASGESEASTVLVHYIRSRKEQIRRWLLRIRPGQTLRLRYSFAPEVPTDTVQTRSYATREAGLPLTLEFTTARMTYHKSGEAPSFGIQVDTEEVIPTAKADQDPNDRSQGEKP